MIAAIESLLFVVGEEGITEVQLKNILEIDEITLSEMLTKLSESYSNDERGIELIKYGNRYKLVTKKENKDIIKKLITIEDNDSLSEAALEVLAIIAYNQPITRNSVDEIRGISSSYLIRRLAYKNLIEEVGRSETAGRPVLYGTSSLFLDHFGLTSIDKLPNIVIDEKNDNVDLYTSKFTDV